MCTLTLYVCRVCFHKMNQSPVGLVGRSIPGWGTPLDYHCVGVCGVCEGVCEMCGWVCEGVCEMCGCVRVCEGV